VTKRRLKAPTETADTKQDTAPYLGKVYKSTLVEEQLMTVEELDDRITTVHNERLDGAMLSNKRLLSYTDVREFQDNPRSFYLQDGAPHTTEDLIEHELGGLKPKHAEDIRQLRRKYDPYALLEIVRALRRYRERVWDLERMLNAVRAREEETTK
jgi:uncharacterized protein YjiS (DUF1127 family)